MVLKQCCDLLESLGLKIAFIESASSGYLSSQFSIYKNSGADILLGGLVSYDPSIKISILHIETQLIEAFSAESAQVTQQMAIRGKVLFDQADIVVSCTGLLKSGGSATPTKPEGTFFICIYFNNQLFNFKYLIEGTPLERLNILTENVAIELLTILHCKSI